MAQSGTTSHMMSKMIWSALFLAFLIFVALPSPIPYDDAGGLIGFALNFLAFLKSFMIGKPQSWKSIRAPASGSPQIPGWDTKGIIKQLR